MMFLLHTMLSKPGMQVGERNPKLCCGAKLNMYRVPTNFHDFDIFVSITTIDCIKFYITQLEN